MQLDERARKNASTIINAMASAGQKVVADKLSIHESTISRMKSDGDLDRFAKLIAVCGLKVVPQEHQCMDSELYEAAMVFARRYISQTERSTLDWGS